MEKVISMDYLQKNFISNLVIPHVYCEMQLGQFLLILEHKLNVNGSLLFNCKVANED